MDIEPLVEVPMVVTMGTSTINSMPIESEMHYYRLKRPTTGASSTPPIRDIETRVLREPYEPHKSGDRVTLQIHFTGLHATLYREPGNQRVHSFSILVGHLLLTSNSKILHYSIFSLRSK